MFCLPRWQPARGLHAALLAALTLALIAGCTGTPQRPAPPTGPHPSPQATPQPPADVAAIPDAVPRPEPRSAKGNPPFYTVLGKRYHVLPTAAGYVERGVASWYGPGFHNAQTSNGEPYDMYAMTAAHKTLPLPAYVQVTHLGNGRSVILRVNDRGPFKDGRIIDLSYTAAAKLGILKAGTAFVEVRALTPNETPNEMTPDETATVAATSQPSALFVQAGAFGTEANASKLNGRLRAQGIANSFVRQDQLNGQPLYRVRVGPIPSVPEFDRVLARLKALGIADARLAAD